MNAVVRTRVGPLPAYLLSAGAMVCATYLLGLATAELLLLTSGLLAGAIAHCVLVLALVGHAIAAPRAPYRRLLIALVLPSLLRLLGLTVPVASTPTAIWYLAAGTPAVIGTILAARMVGLPRPLLAWPRSPLVQLLIAGSGITHGLLAYLALRPAPVGGGFGTMAVTAAAVAIGGAAVEEIVFRGALQSAATAALGGSGAGIAVSTVAFGMMYAGSLSVSFFVLVFAMGLFLGWAVRETGSLWGAIGAHAAMVVGLVVIWPLVLR
jgi:membrane protease YdiL (CAAX protease family)